MAEEGSPHPYVPRDLKLPGYVPISLSQATIHGVNLVATVVVIAFVWLLSGGSPKKARLDRILMCWWAFTGLNHVITEGYFLISPEFYKDANYFAEVWKEYSKGDSRYASRDSSIVAIEVLAVLLVGPASFLAVYAINKNKSYSHILQFAASLGQLWGTFVYLITARLDGNNFSINLFYYYSYLILINGIWIVLPALILIRCWKKICASSSLDGQNKAKAG